MDSCLAMWVVGIENEGSQNVGRCPAMWVVGRENDQLSNNKGSHMWVVVQ